MLSIYGTNLSHSRNIEIKKLRLCGRCTVFRLISACTLFCQIGNNNLPVKLQLRVSTFRATPRQTLSDTDFRSPLTTISRKSRTLVQFPIFLFSSVRVNSLRSVSRTNATRTFLLYRCTLHESGVDRTWQKEAMALEICGTLGSICTKVRVVPAG